MRADPSDPVPAGHPQATRLRFGGFVLDLARGCLLLNEDEIALRPKTFAVMRYLAASPRRLVPKDELFAAVWPGLTVTDDALVQSIGELRRALGKEGAHLIKTVPRRGYRFEAGVSIEGSTDQRSVPVRAPDGDLDQPPEAVSNRRKLAAWFAPPRGGLRGGALLGWLVCAILLAAGLGWAGIIAERQSPSVPRLRPRVRTRRMPANLRLPFSRLQIKARILQTSILPMV